MVKQENGALPPPNPPAVGLQDLLVTAEEQRTEMDKVLALITDNAKIDHFTELTPKEITAFSVLSTLAQRHNLPVLTDFLEQNLRKRVSKGRKGRAELIKIVGRHLTTQEEMNANQVSGWRRMMGGRR